MRRLLAVLGLGLAMAGCGSAPRPLGLERRPADRVPVPTSSTHYRAYASADALAAALRWTPGAEPLVSVHRGAPVAGLPENALPTFEHALNYAPALVEMDVRRTANGVLVLMHDETLERTTTGRGRVDSTSFTALRALRLLDANGVPTAFRVPTFAEALAWAEGRGVLMVDVKAGVPFDEVVGAVRAARAENRVVLIVYTLADHLALAALAPDLNVSATVETPANANALLASGVDLSRTIAFVGVGQADPAVVERLHQAGIRAQVATFPFDEAAALATDPSVYLRFLQSGVDVLATDNVRSASEAVRAYRLSRR